MKELFELFCTFFKIGLTTFGGGYAILPILQREISEKRKWVTDKEITDYYAVGQCTPGIISVNIATFVGYKRKGILGGIIATLGIIFPSIVIILLIANLISEFADLEIIQHIFNGIRVGVAALIISAVIKLWKNSVIDKYTFIIFLVLFLVLLIYDLPPIIVIIISGIAGLLARREV